MMLTCLNGCVDNDVIAYAPPIPPGHCCTFRLDFVEDPESSQSDGVVNKAPLDKWQKDGILILSGLPDTVVRRHDIVVKKPPRSTDQGPASPR